MKRNISMPDTESRLKYILIILAAAVFMLLPAVFVPAGDLSSAVSAVRYDLMDKTGLSITIANVNAGVSALTADPSNGLVLKVTIRDSNGSPVPGAEFELEASGFGSGNAGSGGAGGSGSNGSSGFGTFSGSSGSAGFGIFSGKGGSDGTGGSGLSSAHSGAAQCSARTGMDGACLVVYHPPFLTSDWFKGGDATVKLTASIQGSNLTGNNPADNGATGNNPADNKKESSVDLLLIRIPVVFVHGYKATPDIFNSLRDYLEANGFSTDEFGYNSDNGVASGAGDLEKYLAAAKKEYMDRGIQVEKFDIIAHSMGGLVARYYTCSAGYASRDDVDKLVFLSAPHNGSPIASLGLKYYTDRGIYDLMPDSSLFTTAFPSMINGGLNNTIQTGNILGQYDEVVSPESASLEEWNIKTELFNVGENNYTLDKLLNGEITEAANHKNILFNTKVFRRVVQMLGSKLPYPSKK